MVVLSSDWLHPARLHALHSAVQDVIVLLLFVLIIQQFSAWHRRRCSLGSDNHLTPLSGLQEIYGRPSQMQQKIVSTRAHVATGLFFYVHKGFKFGTNQIR